MCSHEYSGDCDLYITDPPYSHVIHRGSKKCVHMCTAAIGDLYITDPPYSHMIPRGSKKCVYMCTAAIGDLYIMTHLTHT